MSIYLIELLVPKVFLAVFIISAYLVIRYITTPQVDILRTEKVLATAYSSSVEETDSTPCITADGFDLCANGEEEIIAANYLPMGTTVRIPKLFGDKIFTVHDRMNARYGKNRIDIWLSSKERAQNFGAKITEMEIVEVK